MTAAADRDPVPASTWLDAPTASVWAARAAAVEHPGADPWLLRRCNLAVAAMHGAVDEATWAAHRRRMARRADEIGAAHAGALAAWARDLAALDRDGR